MRIWVPLLLIGELVAGSAANAVKVTAPTEYRRALHPGCTRCVPVTVSEPLDAFQGATWGPGCCHGAGVPGG